MMLCFLNRIKQKDNEKEGYSLRYVQPHSKPHEHFEAEKSEASKIISETILTYKNSKDFNTKYPNQHNLLDVLEKKFRSQHMKFFEPKDVSTALQILIYTFFNRTSLKDQIKQRKSIVEKVCGEFFWCPEFSDICAKSLIDWSFTIPTEMLEFVIEGECMHINDNISGLKQEMKIPEGLYGNLFDKTNTRKLALKSLDTMREYVHNKAIRATARLVNNSPWLRKTDNSYKLANFTLNLCTTRPRTRTDKFIETVIRNYKYFPLLKKEFDKIDKLRKYGFSERSRIFEETLQRLPEWASDIDFDNILNTAIKIATTPQTLDPSSAMISSLTLSDAKYFRSHYLAISLECVHSLVSETLKEKNETQEKVSEIIGNRKYSAESLYEELDTLREKVEMDHKDDSDVDSSENQQNDESVNPARQVSPGSTLSLVFDTTDQLDAKQDDTEKPEPEKTMNEFLLLTEIDRQFEESLEEDALSLDLEYPDNDCKNDEAADAKTGVTYTPIKTKPAKSGADTVLPSPRKKGKTEPKKSSRTKPDLTKPKTDDSIVMSVAVLQGIEARIEEIETATLRLQKMREKNDDMSRPEELLTSLEEQLKILANEANADSWLRREINKKLLDCDRILEEVSNLIRKHKKKSKLIESFDRALWEAIKKERLITGKHHGGVIGKTVGGKNKQFIELYHGYSFRPDKKITVGTTTRKLRPNERLVLYVTYKSTTIGIKYCISIKLWQTRLPSDPAPSRRTRNRFENIPAGPHKIDPKKWKFTGHTLAVLHVR
jgi:hypothetical protein